MTLFFLIVVGLLFPVFHLFWLIPSEPVQFDFTFLRVCLYTSLQALLSAVLTLMLGFSSGLGLISLKNRLSPLHFKTLIVFIIVPSFAPPIMVLLTVVSAVNFLPMGLWGIIFFHVLMNIGVVAALFFQMIYAEAGNWFKIACLSDVKVSRFILLGLVPELKFYFQSLFFYLFIIYFFSFSIPMVLGESLFGGVEIFIYEKIFLYRQWGAAIHYCVFLFFGILAFSYFFNRSSLATKSYLSEKRNEFKYFKADFLTLFALLPIGLILVGMIKSLLISQNLTYLTNLLELARGTALVGLLTGFLVFIILSVLSFCYMSLSFSKLLLGFVHPGWVLVGFSFLLLGNDARHSVLLKNSVALMILFAPFLYRLSLFQKLEKLGHQVKVAQLFSVSWWKIFCMIIWPQVFATICFLSGLASLWACGDFALSSVVMSGSDISTLALEMKDLTTSYRFEKAIILLIPLLVVSSIVFFIFQGLSYVSRRKVLS